MIKGGFTMVQYSALKKSCLIAFHVFALGQVILRGVAIGFWEAE